MPENQEEPYGYADDSGVFCVVGADIVLHGTTGEIRLIPVYAFEPSLRADENSFIRFRIRLTAPGLNAEVGTEVTLGTLLKFRDMLGLACEGRRIEHTMSGWNFQLRLAPHQVWPGSFFFDIHMWDRLEAFPGAFRRKPPEEGNPFTHLHVLLNADPGKIETTTRQFNALVRLLRSM